MGKIETNGPVRRTAGSAARNRHVLLAEAGLVLGASLDCEAILDGLADLLVPRLADWCALELLVSVPNRPTCASVRHVDAAREELGRELARRYPPPHTVPLPADEVLHAGRPVLFPRVGAKRMERHARDPEQARICRELGLSTALLVPLSGGGETFGLLALARGGARPRYRAADLDIASDVARRAGTALALALRYQDALRAIGARDEVLAVVAHDLRNLLSVLMLRSGHLARLAERASDAEPLRSDVEAIRRSAHQMEHIIRDLVDSARLQAGTLKVELTPQDVREVVAQAVEAVRPLAVKLGLTLGTELPQAGLFAACDRERLSQVLGNVLGNALKFTPAGGEVSVRAEGTDGEVEVRVIDTGPGIPPDQLPRIFERYFQADPRARGTGLGLFIARAIVEAHGGRIWAESRVGKGTAVVFRLPVKALDPGDAETPPRR